MRTFILNFFLFGVFSLHAETYYTLQIGNINWNGSPGGYNCFSGAAYPNTVDLTITKVKAGNRSYALTAGPSGTSGGYSRQMASGGNRINYQLYTTGSLNYVLKAPPTAIASETLSDRTNLKEDTVIPLSFTFYIPPNQLVSPGTYSDQITFSIYESNDDTGTPQDTRTVNISVVVASGAELAVVPTGSNFSTINGQSLSFGTLTTGRSLGCDLLVRKNTACSVSFSSRNGGVMKLNSPIASDQVSYACSVDGSQLSLVNPTQITLPSGVSTTLDGERLPVLITIGDVGSATAGDYQDEITITVVAN